MNKKLSCRAFTLIEVVVYMGILSIMVAVVIPTLINIESIVQKQFHTAMENMTLVAAMSIIEQSVWLGEETQLKSSLENFSEIISDVNIIQTGKILEIKLKISNQDYRYVYVVE